MNTDIAELLKDHDRARRALLQDEHWPGLDEHVEVCPVCTALRQKLDDLDRLAKVVEEPSRGLLADVLATTRRRMRARPGLLTEVLERTRSGRQQNKPIARSERTDVAIDVRTSILRRLVELARQYGEGPNVVVPLTQYHLADLVGTARATVNRVLRVEERRRSLRLDRGRITVLDLPALAKRAGMSLDGWKAEHADAGSEPLDDVPVTGLRAGLRMARPPQEPRADHEGLEPGGERPGVAPVVGARSQTMLDRTLICRDCGIQFTFTAGEQEFYQAKGIVNEPGRCPECRTLRREGRADVGQPVGSLVEQDVQDTLVLVDGVDEVNSLQEEPTSDSGFVQRVRLLLERFESSTGIRSKLRVSSDWPVRLSTSTTYNLYRIVEEALNNIRLHSGAGKVNVRLDPVGSDAVALTVKDDGRGLVASGDGHRPGMGTMGMRERAVLLDGALDVSSDGNGGVTVLAVVPKAAKESTSWQRQDRLNAAMDRPGNLADRAQTRRAEFVEFVDAMWAEFNRAQMPEGMRDQMAAMAEELAEPNLPGLTRFRFQSSSTSTSDRIAADRLAELAELARRVNRGVDRPEGS
jgi:hypothetical protein